MNVSARAGDAPRGGAVEVGDALVQVGDILGAEEGGYGVGALDLQIPGGIGREKVPEVVGHHGALRGEFHIHKIVTY